MSEGLQWLLVAPLVCAALLFACWRLITRRLRLQLLSSLLRSLPVAEGGVIARWRAVLARRIAADSAPGGCAACSKH